MRGIRFGMVLALALGAQAAATYEAPPSVNPGGPVAFTAKPAAIKAVPGPAIAFAWPAFVSVARGKVVVSDSANRRVSVIRFDHAAAAECAVP